MPTICFSSVTMSADEFVAVNFRLWRAAPATRRNHWILGVGLALLTVSLVLELLDTQGHITTWSTPVLLVVGVAYGLLRAALVRRQLRRGYQQNTVLQQPADFILTDKELQGNSPTGTFRTPWSTLQRAIRVGPNWLLLYPTHAACYYLDLRRLVLPATPTAVEALLAQHSVPVRQLT
ncbi:hypothetical protein MUN82_02550 [Hymenobacter aerilatus]|uniref:YcxB family protein n=1 Tax=Hymenobacter aerilatus TaxID=2932251 RepID=A0A8T9SV17_9BACT|nr:hypothetical protein [Hymenobacter aerilatus]UOR05992.1 hypothetical protein MUN82_02550 [Hymenobacter aerilatus]